MSNLITRKKNQIALMGQYELFLERRLTQLLRKRITESLHIRDTSLKM